MTSNALHFALENSEPASALCASHAERSGRCAVEDATQFYRIGFQNAKEFYTVVTGFYRVVTEFYRVLQNGFQSSTERYRGRENSACSENASFELANFSYVGSIRK